MMFQTFGPITSNYSQTGTKTLNYLKVCNCHHIPQMLKWSWLDVSWGIWSGKVTFSAESEPKCLVGPAVLRLSLLFSHRKKQNP